MAGRGGGACGARPGRPAKLPSSCHESAADGVAVGAPPLGRAPSLLQARSGGRNRAGVEGARAGAPLRAFSRRGPQAVERAPGRGSASRLGCARLLWSRAQLAALASSCCWFAGSFPSSARRRSFFFSRARPRMRFAILAAAPSRRRLVAGAGGTRHREPPRRRRPPPGWGRTSSPRRLNKHREGHLSPRAFVASRKLPGPRQLRLNLAPSSAAAGA